MKVINDKANDFLFAASMCALMIQKFKDNIFRAYPIYLRDDYFKECLEVLLDTYLLICLSTQEMRTDDSLILAKGHSATFKEVIKDAMTYNIYVISCDVRPKLDYEDTREMAEHITKELFKLIDELINQVLTVTEE